MPITRACTAVLFSLALAPHGSAAQWTTLDLQTDEQLYGIHYRSNGNVWIGAIDTAHYSLNSGDTFQKRGTLLPPPLSQPLFGVYLALHAFDDNTAVITGVQNLGAAESIYRTVNGGGVNYTLVHYLDGPLIDRLNDFEFEQAPIGLAVGFNGTILRTTNAGATWSVMPSGTSAAFWNVAKASGNIYLAGGSTTVVRSVDQGLTWAPVPGLAAQHVVAQGATCFAASANGAFWTSTNAGATWTSTGTLVDGVDVLEMVGPNTLIAANQNGLFRSTSSGQYWEHFDLPDYRPLGALDFYDAQHGMAVGLDGYAIRTGNGGGATLPMAVLGADELLLLPMPTITTGTEYVYELVVRQNALGCTWVLPVADTLHVFSPAFSTTLADTLLVEGAPLDLSATPQLLDQVQWNFGTGAVPEQYTGADPPAVTYAVAGTRNVTVDLVLGNSICTAQRTATISVFAPAPETALPDRGGGDASGGLYISDLYLDGFNNRYITGQYHGGVSANQRQFFVMELDSTGTMLWQYKHHVNPTNPSFGLGITADAQGNAYVSGTAHFNAVPINGVVIPHTNFLLKFDRQGQG